jgi:hypothetical protein
MSSDPLAPELRRMPAADIAPKTGKQSTNCGVHCLRGAGGFQSPAISMLEAVANVLAGFLIALLGQQLILPLFAIHVGLAAHFGIATLFTLLSLVRSYLLRRLFNHMAWRRQEERRKRQQHRERGPSEGSC